MRKPPNTWPNTELANNVMFFAQLVRELLDPDSFESNRVFSLDTLSRLNECIDLHSEFKKNAVTKSTLRSAFEEAKWSIGIDPVVCREFSEPAKNAVVTELGQFGDVHNAQRAMVYARNRLEPIYKECLEKLIVEGIRSGQKIQLRVATSFYCSYLINISYSRAYILGVANKIFFDPLVLQRVSVAKVEQFFRHFSGLANHYYVYSAVSAELASILGEFSKEVKPSNQKLNHHDADVKAKFRPGRGQKYAFFEINARDPNTAAAYTNGLIEHFRALSLLNPAASKVDWKKEFYIAKKRDRSGNVFEVPNSPKDWLSPRSTARPKILRDIRRYSQRIIDNFERDSFYRVLDSVQTAAGARYSSSVESQLVSLWSAVEVLIGQPIDDSPRINHFSERVLPCICRRHIHRRSQDLYEVLRSEYGTRVNRIVRDVPQLPGVRPHFRFTAIFMFAINQPLRDRLLTLTGDNPLARHRMFQFYEDCKSPAALTKCVQNHRQRVKWQLHRIYRARNSLVHQANPPAYLDSLVLNMFEYYIRMLAAIVRSASKSQYQVAIDDIVSEIQLESVALSETLKAKKGQPEIDEELFRLINA